MDPDLYRERELRIGAGMLFLLLEGTYDIGCQPLPVALGGSYRELLCLGCGHASAASHAHQACHTQLQTGQESTLHSIEKGVSTFA